MCSVFIDALFILLADVVPIDDLPEVADVFLKSRRAKHPSEIER